MLIPKNYYQNFIPQDVDINDASTDIKIHVHTNQTNIHVLIKIFESWHSNTHKHEKFHVYFIIIIFKTPQKTIKYSFAQNLPHTFTCKITTAHKKIIHQTWMCNCSSAIITCTAKWTYMYF